MYEEKMGGSRPTSNRPTHVGEVVKAILRDIEEQRRLRVRACPDCLTQTVRDMELVP